MASRTHPITHGKAINENEIQHDYAMKAIITISDLHVGSTVGICPERVKTVDSGTYLPNKYQRTLLKYWRHFWTLFVPDITKGADKVILVINGDIIDGVHHNTVNILANSWAVQEYAAIELLKGIHKLCPVKIDDIYVVKGTETHVGPNGESEDRIADAIGANANGDGEVAAYQRWIDVDNVLFQFAHHIGTTSSAASNVRTNAELVSAMVEAAQWGQKIPHVIVRSHRHRFIEVPIPSVHGRIRCVITPGWQVRTPFTERIDRMRMPHIGGVGFLVQDDRCQVIEKIYPLPGPKPTQI